MEHSIISFTKNQLLYGKSKEGESYTISESMLRDIQNAQITTKEDIEKIIENYHNNKNLFENTSLADKYKQGGK